MPHNTLQNLINITGLIWFEEVIGYFNKTDNRKEIKSPAKWRSKFLGRVQ